MDRYHFVFVFAAPCCLENFAIRRRCKEVVVGPRFFKNGLDHIVEPPRGSFVVLLNFCSQVLRQWSGVTLVLCVQRKKILNKTLPALIKMIVYMICSSRHRTFTESEKGAGMYHGQLVISSLGSCLMKENRQAPSSRFKRPSLVHLFSSVHILFFALSNIIFSFCAPLLKTTNIFPWPSAKAASG